MINEKLIMTVLELTGLPAIPEPLARGEKRVWVRAVARVLKCNNNEGFALLRNVYDGVPRIIKSFDDHGVAKILDIRPYEWLEKRFVGKVEEILSDPRQTKAFVAAAYGIPEERLRTTSTAKARSLVYNYCIEEQIKGR